MLKKRVTVLRGGQSDEYHISMLTGANVIESLLRSGYQIQDIVITKQGEWLEGGIAKKPEQLISLADVVFLCLHGSFGEDGEVQKIIQRYNIPFNGSRSLPSAVSFNKDLTKQALRPFGVTMPEHQVVSLADLHNLEAVTDAIIARFGPEYIIKPLANGSSLGITQVKEGQSLLLKLRAVLAEQEKVLVEEFIRGREATLAILENFREQAIYTFPVVEIIPPTNADYFTAEVKYSGETKEICPGDFSYSEREQIADFATSAHKVLGLSQYSRSDFIVKNGKVYFLEINTLPGLTKESLYPKAAESVGLSFDQLVSFLVETATT